ncbi:hypothetical protein [Christensenella hongkongensis]|uniref:Uncharacterized protein n=1 Tax=Christensenella hongkongensis TaxID=270498 RepID=A0A0M2NFA2_9FIRM|nr:hypothetical protein [Christensenella hongkongensis]KKI51209.1 hypothetical protein CHK_1596 [Christensenella hongkongensis]TCW30389.1 hypothetical protein EV208_1029 [Christensenella hongkongensis]
MPKARIVRAHDAVTELETLKEEKIFLQNRECEQEGESIVKQWIEQIDEDIKRNSMKTEEKSS